MKKILPLLLALLLVPAFYFYQKSNQLVQQEKATEETSPSPSINKYSLAEVEKHNTKDNCWFAVSGKVYDVTPYVASGMHPGKEAILEGCGKDATVLFNTRPMGSGTAHSDRARDYLNNFQIGDLQE
ncbi:cytochrome b5 domain-containing protein [Patescibacteria group bacterium]|nr:cytochrome b5 domain-containing protein [Patescibacteria group bacterium]